MKTFGAPFTSRDSLIISRLPSRKKCHFRAIRNARMLNCSVMEYLERYAFRSSYPQVTGTFFHLIDENQMGLAKKRNSESAAGKENDVEENSGKLVKRRYSDLVVPQQGNALSTLGYWNVTSGRKALDPVTYLLFFRKSKLLFFFHSL